MKKVLLIAIFIASPLMGQESVKSIFSVNYSFGASGGISVYETDTTYYTKFQSGASLEYIVGKKWHAHFGLSGIFLDEPKGAFTIGFGATLIDARNTEGIGLMFDWNILSVGLALSENNLGYSGATSFKFRYMLKQKVGLQFGFNIQSYVLILPPLNTESTTYSTDSGSLEMNFGFTVGVSFGG